MAFGEFPVVELSTYTFAKNQGVKIASPALSFLLRSGDDIILVDTGPSAVAENHHSSHVPLRFAPEFSPRAALGAKGLAPEDIKTIVLTHLHYDHACNLEMFPAARIYVQAEELRFAVDPINYMRAMYEFGQVNDNGPGSFVPAWMRATAQLQVLRGDYQLAPGVRLLHLPGHTPGMQAVLIDTEAGQYLLASDIVSSFDNLGPGPTEWTLPGIHTDLVACQRSLETMVSLGATILPSHDWRVTEQAIYPLLP
jgi:glyoxylase-like metal-dependent hydrolase (beta-lactamase superfamily II)